jgi:hypothetical protein
MTTITFRPLGRFLGARPLPSVILAVGFWVL